MSGIQLMIIVLLGSTLNAQSLQVEAQHHDFGRVGSNTKVVHSFLIRNQGSKDLLICSARTSCGCTSLVMGRVVVPPGESTNIEVTFNPGNSMGRVEKTIQVSSNDAKTPMTTLFLTAEIIRDLYIDPTTAMFFNSPRMGPRDLTLQLKSDSGPVKGVALDVASLPYLSSRVRIEGDTAALDLRFDPAKAPKGLFQGHGRFEVKTSQPTNGTLVIPVLWSLARTFVVTPDRIGMQIMGGQEQRATLRISRADGKSFHILRASAEATTSKGLKLKVHFPNSFAGKFGPGGC